MIFIVFIFGIIFGSFLNVVGLRWNSGLTLQGRSFCPSCHKELHWYELMPIVSFFFLKGRCSKCKTLISWQYSLVEVWTGLIFVSVFIKFLPLSLNYANLAGLLLALIIFCIYVVIVIYDLRHKIIPDTLVYLSAILAIGFHYLYFGNSLLDWLAGPILFAFFGGIWLVSKGRAMGFGDAKLGLSIGIFLGAANGFSGIILAFWIGSLITLLYMLLLKLKFPLWRRGKRLTMKSEVPFAPFMILGAWLAFIYSVDLLHVLSFQ
jgi:prepilin signal peptidase PulO-like enzyme (type II secretory pathway)